jgi:UDP-2,3-diacylglucosamine pyrophosphatase LpxH
MHAKNVTSKHVLNARAMFPNSMRDAAEHLGIGISTFHYKLAKAEKEQRNADPGFELEPPPEFEFSSVEDLIKRKKKNFRAKKARLDHAHNITVKIKERGPFGICFFGDPHLDDDGCDIETLEETIKVVRETKGMFAASIGDVTNNWMGRLAKLYAKQSTSRSDAIELMKWFVDQLPWVLLIRGNHDMWSGKDDPLIYLAQETPAHVVDWQATCKLVSPNGQEFSVCAAHNFKGHSQWNNQHGANKRAQFDGRHDLYICGHTHEFGMATHQHPHTKKVYHTAKARGFKFNDEYALVGGFSEHTVGHSITFVADPRDGATYTFACPEKASLFLTSLRES